MNKEQLLNFLDHNFTMLSETEIESSDNKWECKERENDTVADRFAAYFNEKMDLINGDRKYLTTALNSTTKSNKRNSKLIHSGIVYHISDTSLRDLYESRGITFPREEKKYFIRNIEDTANILKIICKNSNKSVEDFDVWFIDDNLFNAYTNINSTIELNSGRISRYSLILLKPGNNYEVNKGKLQ